MTVPEKIAVQVMFLSDRTCCVCRKKKKVQIHHIDGDKENNDSDNLAVLCLECHDETQIRGGFGRKLNAEQIKVYRDDWYSRVSTKRSMSIKLGVVEKEKKYPIHWRIFGPKILPDPTDLTLERIKSISKFFEQWMVNLPIYFPIRFEIKNNGDDSMDFLVRVHSITPGIVFRFLKPKRKWVWKPVLHRKIQTLSLKDELRLEVPGAGQPTNFTFDANYYPSYAQPFLKRAVIDYNFEYRTSSGSKFVAGPYRIEIPIKPKGK